MGEAVGAIAKAAQGIGEAVQAGVTAVGGVTQAIKAVSSVAAIGMGIAEVVDGNTEKGMAMMLGGAALGADTYQNIPSSAPTTSADSGGGLLASPKAETPVNMGAAEPDTAQTQLANSVDKAATFETPVSKSLSSEPLPVQSTTNNIGRPGLIGTALPSTDTSTIQPAKVTSTVQSTADVNRSENKPTLLSGLTNFVKDNKELISMVGGAISDNDKTQTYLDEKERDRQFIRDQAAQNTIIPSNMNFNSATGKYTPK